MQPATTDPSQINTNCQVRSPLSQASALLRQTRIFTTCLSEISLSHTNYPRTADSCVLPPPAWVSAFDH
jgi:hypothetical protein